MSCLSSLRCLTWMTSLALVLLSGIISSTYGQDDVSFTDEILPPEYVDIALHPIGETLTPTSAKIEWEEVENADSYVAVVFKKEDGEVVLHESIKNVAETEVVFDDLSPSTQYEVVVSSVQIQSDGTSRQSKDATRFTFSTPTSCVGGMVWVPCKAHCIPTCAIPYPACDRRCISGCTCPSVSPFYHNERCITKKECKENGAPPTEIVKRPKNLSIHKIKGSKDLLFTWDKVEGASYYRVLVFLRDGTEVQRHNRVGINVIIVKDLKTGVGYKFKVQAIFEKSSARARILNVFLPPMQKPVISQITARSFFARWSAYPLAISYQLIIVAAENGEIIQIFRDLTDLFITVQGLEPESTYEVYILAIMLNNQEQESPSVQFQTLNETVFKDLIYPEDETEIIHVIEETTTTTRKPATTTPYVPTCEEERLSKEQFLLDFPGSSIFIPQCNLVGNYRPRQCTSSGCYCVKIRTGEKLEGSDFDSIKSEFALDCNKYGKLDIPAVSVKATALNSNSIRVGWLRVQEAAFYIVKIYHGFTGVFVRAIIVSERKIEVKGLDVGTPYIVIVVAVDSEGASSSDAVRGAFVATSYFDPPSNVRLEQHTENEMRISWSEDPTAQYHQVEIKEGDNRDSTKYENIIENQLTFRVKPDTMYTVTILSTGVASIPGSGKTVLVSSNPVILKRPSTCTFPPLDVIFVIDISNRMLPTEYDISKIFYQRLVYGLTPLAMSDRDRTGSRYAAVKTYGITRTMFPFNSHDNPANAFGAIRFVRQTGTSNFNIDRMVDHVFKNFLQNSQSIGPRSNVQTAVISFFGDAQMTASPTFEAKTRRLRAATNLITATVSGRFAVNGNKIEIASYQDIDVAYKEVMKLLCKLK